MEFMFLTSFSEVISYVWYIFLAILILLAMITVHEFGHYVTGKIFKFNIEEFSIGFGPKLFFKKRKNGEFFSVRLIPLGGFCSFKGEDEDNADPSAFNNKKPWQRMIVLFSGAFMNYVFAVFLIILMFAIYGNSALLTYKMIDDPSIPTEYAFQSEDVILKAEGKNVYTVTDLMLAIQGKQNSELVSFEIIRDGKVQQVYIMLRGDTQFKNLQDAERLYSSLGIYYETTASGQMINGGLYSTGVTYGFFDTIGRAFEYSFKTAGTVFTVLHQLFSGQIGLSSMGGTITTITTTAEAISIGGFWYFLNVASFIGVNLAVFNLLPIPALDGSRIMFTSIEWIRKKPLPRRVEAVIHGIGFVLIFLFAILVDLQRCF